MVVAVFTAQSAGTSAPVVGAVAGLLFLLARRVPKLTTTAWDTGAAGEMATARILDRLVDYGFVVMHDLRRPRSRGNIDHLVIGPTGIFIVETKNYDGRLEIRNGEAFIKGRRLGLVEQVERERFDLDRILGDIRAGSGWPIEALVVVHRADLPWFRRQIGNVRVVSPRELTKAILGHPPILSAAQVSRLTSAAEPWVTQ